MKHLFPCLLFAWLVLSLQQKAHAEEVTLPTGTLLNCTLDEPNLSSASAQVGDPVICRARGVQQFGRVVFSRGAYLAGRLAAEKDPGHFWGKGLLKLEFDHISLPDTALPLPGKIVAVRGYRVDKEGNVIGHGHPKRDAIEWLIPPLWPWKLPDAAGTGPAPRAQGRDGTDFAPDGRCGRATRCCQFAADGSGLGRPENVESANGLVGKADEQFVAHSPRSSEHSGDAERTGQRPSNEVRASARDGFQFRSREPPAAAYLDRA